MIDGHAEAAEVAEILAELGLEPSEYQPIVNSLRKNPKAWLEFMMKYLYFRLLHIFFYVYFFHSRLVNLRFA